VWKKLFDVEGMSNFAQTMMIMILHQVRHGRQDNHATNHVKPYRTFELAAPSYILTFMRIAAHRAAYLFWLQVYMQQLARKKCSGARRHVELSAAAVIFRHGLPKTMSKKYENVELLCCWYCARAKQSGRQRPSTDWDLCLWQRV
jgi:hypothetical protein